MSSSALGPYHIEGRWWEERRFDRAYWFLLTDRSDAPPHRRGPADRCVDPRRGGGLMDDRVRPPAGRLLLRLSARGQQPGSARRRRAGTGMETLALTDLHNPYGAPRFERACMAAGIRPIHGVEVATTTGDASCCSCATRAGWTNLCRLCHGGQLRRGEGEAPPRSGSARRVRGRPDRAPPAAGTGRDPAPCR